jgi:xanthine phosphoribosyltransferase
MRQLVERIKREGKNLGGGILKVDAFLNHQLEPELTLAMGEHFRRAFEAAGVEGVDKVITAEVSGIAPALATGLAYGVPVVYARKQRPITMPATVFETQAPSHTKGGMTKLIVSPEYLRRGERVLLIDDFLATGRTVDALAELVSTAGGELLGMGFVIEKAFEGGRERLVPFGVPIVSLAVIERMDDVGIHLRE